MNDMEDNSALGLTNEQTDKILQFQDLTGIEDMTVCREFLQRHQWNIEVAIQEQLNIREGRPSLFATEARPPQVVRDHVAQHIFSSGDTPDNDHPTGVRGLFSFIINLAFSICYNIFTYITSIFKEDERRIVTDPLGDVMSFITNYSAKYTPHPVFYQGTYSQALNDAKQELKFLLIYLHSESASETQNFCRYTLANEQVIGFINERMLMWGCNVEAPEGWRVSQVLGSSRKFPLICVIALRENKMVVMGRIEGACSADLLLNRMRRIVDDNEIHLSRARADRIERSLTASLRAQQDAAYEQSLRADQEKERLKMESKKRELEQQILENNRIADDEKKKKDLENAKIHMATQLPPEPKPTDPDAILFLIKLPCGARLERRFSSSNNLKDVYNFVFSHPLSPEEFEITTNFPKRVLDCSNDSLTLDSAGLKNKDVLFVNDCNA